MARQAGFRNWRTQAEGLPAFVIQTALCLDALPFCEVCPAQQTIAQTCAVPRASPAGGPGFWLWVPGRRGLVRRPGTRPGRNAAWPRSRRSGGGPMCHARSNGSSSRSMAGRRCRPPGLASPAAPLCAAHPRERGERHPRRHAGTAGPEAESCLAAPAAGFPAPGRGCRGQPRRRPARYFAHPGRHDSACAARAGTIWPSRNDGTGESGWVLRRAGRASAQAGQRSAGSTPRSEHAMRSAGRWRPHRSPRAGFRSSRTQAARPSA
jgi:hypothetical protein